MRAHFSAGNAIELRQVFDLDDQSNRAISFDASQFGLNTLK